MAFDFTRRPKGFNSPTGKLDFDRTATALRDRAASVCQHLLPHGHREGNEWRAGDLHGTAGKSLGVHLGGDKAGVWKDFSGGDGGNDLISLWARIKGLKMGEAKREADAWLGISESAPSASATIRHGTIPKATAGETPASPPPAGDDDSWWRGRKADARWDYFDAAGKLWGSVYRFNHPAGGKKVIRPWDPVRKVYLAPEGARPLYNLKAILETPGPVVIVEGEKKVDALQNVGILATTSWGGAAGVAVTDWSPLKGRDALRWPDNDIPVPGKVRAADTWLKLTGEALAGCGAASVRDVTVPADKPAKWDAADATDEERRQIVADGLASRAVPVIGARPLVLVDWRTTTAFKGDPPPRRYLVNEVFPAGVACGLAAQGDTGKGMLTLDLALKVAQPPMDGMDFSRDGRQAVTAFGCRVGEHGTAVILSAEDDHGELHRRLNGIDPTGALRAHAGERLIVVPLPSHGGAPALFRATSGGVETTPAWDDIVAQLLRLEDLKLVVFDPLAAFVQADINGDPSVGQFVCGRFAAMGEATGATVLVPQHMGKGSRDRPVTTIEEARHAVRGTSALVDGMRAVYALWPMVEGQARRVCKTLGLDWQRGMVVGGGVVKSNGPADRTLRTYIRNMTSGLLEDATDRLRAVKPKPEALLEMLVEEIEAAAADMDPFTATGTNGLFARRFEMAPEFRSLSKGNFDGMLERIMVDKRVTRVPNKLRMNCLDIPKGVWATEGNKGETTLFCERRARRVDVDGVVGGGTDE